MRTLGGMLLTEVIRAIFRSLNQAKSEVRAIEANGSPYRNTARVIYTLLRCHDAMAEYTNLGFKDHPAVAAEYVKFLATHSAHQDLAKMKKELVLIQSTAKSAQTEAKQATSTAKDALRIAKAKADK